VGTDEESKRLKVLLLVAALMLCLAVIPMWPCGYYTFLRLTVCGVAAYAAFKLKSNSSLSGHFIPLVLVAILFNPLIPVHMGRQMWLPVDLGGAVYFLMLSKKL